MTTIQATYDISIRVTREVAIDDEHFADWIEYQSRREHGYDDNDDALIAYLNDGDNEFPQMILHDWKTSEPMPDDFELQYADVTEVSR